MTGRLLTIIGERINPGFRSSKELFEKSDIPGIQRVAVRQAEAGASYLNVNIGTRALEDAAFMREVIGAIQEAVDLPLSFDFPNLEVQVSCLEVFDAARARDRKPIINSVAETRWSMTDALSIRPAKVILMVSERLDGEAAVPNTTAAEVLDTSQRMVRRLIAERGLAMDDIIIDVSISMLATDRSGGTRMALDAVRLIGSDPELTGVHIMGGISNIGMGLPAKAVDGTALKNGVERAFITLAQPLGLDTILATPWENYGPLSEDSAVLTTFRDAVAASGMDALQAVRRLYRA